MNWFKETYTLMNWMFTSHPSEFVGKDLELVIMKHYPFKGYRFMSWCGRIIIRKEREEALRRFLNTPAGDVSRTHENGHKVQAIAEHNDNWLRYYWMYFIHWIKHNPLTNPSSACYYCNRYEVEAFAQEEHPEYWQNYSRTNLKRKYSIKKAKKQYKRLGGKPNLWKTYVKAL